MEITIRRLVAYTSGENFTAALKKCFVFLPLCILFRIIALTMPGRELGYAQNDGFDTEESDDDSVIVEEVSIGLGQSLRNIKFQVQSLLC